MVFVLCGKSLRSRFWRGGGPRKWLNLSDAPFLWILGNFGFSGISGFYIGDRFPEFGQGRGSEKYINRSVFDKTKII